MESFPVADQILRLSSAEIPRRYLDLAVTVLMLQRSGYNPLLGYEGLRKRRYQIDARFVVKLLNVARDKEARLGIVSSPAFAGLPGSVHRRLFFRYWRRHGRDGSWRYALGWSLGPFLMNNPQDGPLYADPIWMMAMDPDEGIACQGVSQMHYLGRALTLKQCEALITFTHHDSVRAGSAMSSLGTLYKNFKSLRSEVQALFLDPRTIATLRSANPRDGRGKWSCYGWCITHMRKVLRRTGTGRTLRLVGRHAS